MVVDAFDVLALALAKTAPEGSPAGVAQAGAAPQAEPQPPQVGNPAAAEPAQDPGEADGAQAPQPEEGGEQLFLDEAGKIDWRGLEGKDFYQALPVEAQASLKGTIAAYRKAMSDHKSAAGIRRDAENTFLRDQVGTLQQQMRELMGLVGRTAPTTPGPSPAAPGAPPSPLSPTPGEDPELTRFRENHPAFKALSTDEFMPPAEAMKLQTQLMWDISQFAAQKLQAPLAAQAQEQAGRQVVEQVTEQLKGDPAHPVLFRDAARAFDEAVKTQPWLAAQVDAMARAGAPQERVVEFIYQTGIQANPELLAKAQPKSPPKPAPGKQNASPVGGAAPAPSKTPDTFASEFVAACKRA